MCRPTTTSNGTTSTSNGDDDNDDGVLRADYLVIGAGTAGMSFIDTLLTYDATATVILVDRHRLAGGHWTTAYPFVRLHQPACNYGVNSLPLGKVVPPNSNKNNNNKNLNEPFSIDDRSSGLEIVEYYGRVLKQFRDSGRVHLLLDSEFAENQRDDDESASSTRTNGAATLVHTVTNRTTGAVRRVACTQKLVKVHTNLLVPSMRDGPPFPMDSRIKMAVVNDLPMHVRQRDQKYIVIGAGKTGCDSITYLLRHGGVNPDDITWIVSRDVWYFMRDGLFTGKRSHWQDTVRLMRPLEKADSVMEAFLAMEQDGIFARLDPIHQPPPKVFKGATIDYEELEGLRSIKNVVRMGRVTEITRDKIVMKRGSIALPSRDALVVDCMADLDGTFYGYNYSKDFRIFEPSRINLGPLISVFNPSHSSAILAYMEAMTEDDCDKRNSVLYFPYDEHAVPIPINFFCMFYCEMKTVNALGKAFPPASDFMLHARTNDSAPSHHGGIPSFLWGMFGPPRIASRAAVFTGKVENGGYSDCPNAFGHAGREMPKSKLLRAKVKTNARAKSKKDTEYAPYPPQRQSTTSYGKGMVFIAIAAAVAAVAVATAGRNGLNV